MRWRGFLLRIPVIYSRVRGCPVFGLTSIEGISWGVPRHSGVPPVSTTATTSGSDHVIGQAPKTPRVVVTKTKSLSCLVLFLPLFSKNIRNHVIGQALHKIPRVVGKDPKSILPCSFSLSHFRKLLKTRIPCTPTLPTGTVLLFTSKVVRFCLQKNPKERPNCSSLLGKKFFKRDLQPNSLVKEMLVHVPVVGEGESGHDRRESG